VPEWVALAQADPELDLPQTLREDAQVSLCDRIIGTHKVPAGQALSDADARAVGKRLAVAAQDTGGRPGQRAGDLGRAQASDPHDDAELIATITAYSVRPPGACVSAHIALLRREVVAGSGS
jgi:hypothetical protein